jgi:hypothetical protein
VSTSAYIIVVAITLTTIAIIIRQVRMRRLKAKYALMWLLVAVVTLPVALIPGLLDEIASALGVAYGPALLLVLGLGFLAVLSVHFSCEVTRLEERTRVLAEEVALLRSDLQRDGTQHTFQSEADPEAKTRSKHGLERNASIEGAAGAPLSPDSLTNT